MYYYSRINFINDFFFYCLLLYSIFSISFRQEEQIHDFLHLLRITPLNSLLLCPFDGVAIVASLHLADDTVVSCFVLVSLGSALKKSNSFLYLSYNFFSVPIHIYSGFLSQLVVYHVLGLSIIIYIIDRPSLLIYLSISTFHLTSSFWACIIQTGAA